MFPMAGWRDCGPILWTTAGGTGSRGVRGPPAAALNPSPTEQLLSILCGSGAAEPGLGNKEHNYPAALRTSQTRKGTQTREVPDPQG